MPGGSGPGRVDVDPTLQWRRVVLYGYPHDTFPNNVERLFTNHLRVNERAVERLQLIRGRRGDVTAFAQFATEGDARLVIDTLTRKADRGAPITFRDCALSASHLHDWPRQMDRPRWIPCVAAPGWTPDPRNDVRNGAEPAPVPPQRSGSPLNAVNDLGRWEKWGPRWWECHVDTRGHMGGVIGKSGATIKKLQAETGAKMRFNKEAGGAAANEVVVWSNSEHVAVAGARAVCALIADLVESSRGGARGRRESLGTRGAARKAHSSDPEDGEIHEGAVVLALGGGDDALDFTDILPTTAAADGRNPRECVGRRLRVWWPGEGRYFAGVVDRWDESRKLHVVRYDDGDVEAVDLARETWDWEKADEDREGEKGRVDEQPPPPPPSERRGAERTPDLPRAPEPEPAPRAEEPGVESEPTARVADPNAKQFTCDACGKGPYNAKGIKLHRKMWCNKEGPFVGKKKGSETAAAPGDAKKRPRSASADRFGFVDEAGGERGERGDVRDTPEPEEPAIGPSFDAMRTQIENEFATRTQLESTLRDLDTDAEATAAARGAFVRVRLKRKNALDSGYACEQIDRVSRYQPGLAAGVTPARDEGWEWKVHFGSGSSAVRFLSNTRPDREETFGWMVRHFVKDGAQLAGAGTKRART